MKILRYGSGPIGIPKYKYICKDCGCIFLFLETETDKNKVNRYKTQYTIKCPQCGERITIINLDYYKVKEGEKIINKVYKNYKENVK